MKLTVASSRFPQPTVHVIALAVAGLVLGLLLAVRWQSVGVAPTDAGARERAAQAVEQLEQEQEQLKQEVARLREELNTAQKQAAQNTDLLASMSAELEQERIAAGLVPLKGPGVVIVLDDSTRTGTATGAAAESYIVHEYDLRDVVNLLWAGGAEAVAINSERLVNTTSIYCVGSTIMVNDTRLSPPYEVRAIGEAQRLIGWLEDPAYLTLLRQRVKAYDVQFRVAQANEVNIPAYSGTYNIRYAHAGEVTP